MTTSAAVSHLFMPALLFSYCPLKTTVSGDMSNVRPATTSVGDTENSVIRLPRRIGIVR